jgi:hypothetical protein
MVNRLAAFLPSSGRAAGTSANRLPQLVQNVSEPESDCPQLVQNIAQSSVEVLSSDEM